MGEEGGGRSVGCREAGKVVVVAAALTRRAAVHWVTYTRERRRWGTCTRNMCFGAIGGAAVAMG